VSDPTVSIVIPVYNGRRYLAEAIDSVLAQTYPHVEVVVVNDGSTDNSAEIIASYGNRIVVVEQENQGVGAARNAGMQRATGQFIALLDQDDWWRPEKLEKQVAQMIADDRLVLLHTGAAHYDDATAGYREPLDPEATPERLTGPCYDRLLLDNQIYNSSVMVRASALAQVGLCDPEIRGNTVQDYDLWLRLARAGHFGFLDEELIVFRVHGDQGTWDRRQMLTEEARMLERAIGPDKRAVAPAMRTRMASLYNALATAHIDAGDRRLARRNFARSLRWQFSRRAAVLWNICLLLPISVIHRLQAARG